jgi:outer membrane immunogenic protein
VQVGWTLGAGFEYAFTNNITFGAEYLYYDLGGKSTTINALNAPAIASGVFAVQDADTAGSIVRARVNYKF